MEATSQGTKGDRAGNKGEERKRARSEKRDCPQKVAAVLDALELLSSGRAKNKLEACAMAGLAPSALSPEQLNILFRSAPEFKQTSEVSLLDILHDGNGAPESVRQSLSRGVVAAAAVLGRCAAKVGSLNRDEVASLKQARDWLTLCREAGLWQADKITALPGELRDSGANHELDLLGVDKWLRDHSRRDGIGPAAVKVLTERELLKPSESVESASDDED